MPRLPLNLNDAETQFLQALASSAGVGAQDVLRAALYLIDQRQALQRQVAEAAREQKRIQSLTPPGQQKGYTADDYRRAIKRAGSIVGAARLLGVHRKTVREMVDLYEIDVPTLR